MNINLDNSKQIMEKYMPLIKSMARKFGVFEYEENICESQMILIEAIGTYDKTKGTFGNYLKNQLRYHFLDKSKKEIPISLYLCDENGNPLIDGLMSDIDIEKDLLEDEKNKNLLKAVEKLDKKYQTIVKMKYYLNMTNKEIGEKLNLSPKTIANRNSLAVEKLRQILKEK